MAVHESLKQIRAQWMERISRELARGEGVRADFLVQLERFYDLLEQTIVTGDTAWLDPILYDWGHSPTETNLEEGAYEVLIHRQSHDRPDHRSRAQQPE